MPLFVVDASHWQEDIDAVALKAKGVVGCIHKCTEIMRFKGPEDEFYEPNKARCLAAGLLWGSYLYIDPTDGKQQADFYLDTVKPDGQTLLAIDVEEAGITLQQVEDAITRIHERMGVYPMLYTSWVVLNRIGGLHSDILGMCNLWLAGKPYTMPPQWMYYTLYQTGYLKVGSKEFDLNIFNGTLDDLKKVWELTSPNTQLIDKVRVIAAVGIPVYQGPGLKYPIVDMYTKDSTVNIVHGSSKEDVDNPGVMMVQTPLDMWVRLDQLQIADNTNPTPDPLPTPSPVVRYATAVLNMRANPSITANILVQVPNKAKVTVTLPALTSQYHYISATYVNPAGKSFTGWVTNDSLSANPQ